MYCYSSSGFERFLLNSLVLFILAFLIYSGFFCWCGLLFSWMAFSLSLPSSGWRSLEPRQPILPFTRRLSLQPLCQEDSPRAWAGSLWSSPTISPSSLASMQTSECLIHLSFEQEWPILGMWKSHPMFY